MWQSSLETKTQDLQDQDQDRDSRHQDRDQDQDLRSQDQDQDQDFQNSVSRRLETKTQVSRTPSLDLSNSLHSMFGQKGDYGWNFMLGKTKQLLLLALKHYYNVHQTRLICNKSNCCGIQFENNFWHECSALLHVLWSRFCTSSHYSSTRLKIQLKSWLQVTKIVSQVKSQKSSHTKSLVKS